MLIYAIIYFLSGAAILAIAVVAVIATGLYVLGQKVDFGKKKEKVEQPKVQKKPVIKKYKVVDLDDNMRVICSYDYEADAIIKVRELRKQKRQVMIKIK